MRFIPKSEKEIAEANLWPDGTYDFEIVDAEDTISKSQNDMIKLRIRLHNADGGTLMVDDYLVDTDKTAYKIRHCAEAVGLLAAYENGELDARDLMNRAGQCKVRIQKDKNGQYPDKNSISDYVKPAAGSAAPARAPAQRALAPVGGGDIDDDIPFAACWQ